MIYEFALEPKLLNNWKDYRYFVEKFGVQHGRLISSYPLQSTHRFWRGGGIIALQIAVVLMNVMDMILASLRC